MCFDLGKLSERQIDGAFLVANEGFDFGENIEELNAVDCWRSLGFPDLFNGLFQKSPCFGTSSHGVEIAGFAPNVSPPSAAIIGRERVDRFDVEDAWLMGKADELVPEPGNFPLGIPSFPGPHLRGVAPLDEPPKPDVVLLIPNFAEEPFVTVLGED